MEITKSDLALVRNALNSDKFLSVLKSYGYEVTGGRFVVETEFDFRELTQRVLIDTQVAAQVPIDDDYWYQTYGIPKPKNYEALKKSFDKRKQGDKDSQYIAHEDIREEKGKPVKEAEKTEK